MHDVADSVLCYGVFYLMLLQALLTWGSWNPVAISLGVFHEICLNNMGHCGYALPAWLEMFCSCGVSVLPNFASSKTHFIHHLDGRCNRGLFFCHWDWLAGTLRREHPAIDPAC